MELFSVVKKLARVFFFLVVLQSRSFFTWGRSLRAEVGSSADSSLLLASPSSPNFCTLRLIEGNALPSEANSGGGKNESMALPEQHQVVVCEVEGDNYNVLSVKFTQSERMHVIRAASAGASVVPLSRDFISSWPQKRNITIQNARTQIVDRAPSRRDLQEKNTILPAVELDRCSKGSNGVRLIRIRFRDAQPSKTLEAWKEEIIKGTSSKRLGDATPFSQFNACSGGQFSLYAKEAHDVFLPDKSVWDYQDYPSLLFHMTKHVLEDHLGIDRNEDDHTLFCVPLAEGGFPFIGAGMKNGNKVVLSEDWCSDLVSVMHEIGHNCGLGHAKIGDDLDDTWVMGRTGPAESIGYPKRCFSPADMVRLGWFRPHTYFLNDAEVQEGLKVNLVGFGESQRLRKRDADPIILAYKDYRIQFNTIEDSMNGDIQHNRKAVTILRATLEETSNSEANLWERNRTDFAGLTFRVCRVIGEGGRFQSAHLSVGVNGKLHCRKPLVNQVTATMADGSSRQLATVDGSQSSLVSMDTGSNNAVRSQIVIATRPECGGKTPYKIKFHWPYGGPEGTGLILQRRCPWIEKDMPKHKRELLCHQRNLLSTNKGGGYVWQYCKHECDAWAQCIRQEEFPVHAEVASNIFHS